MILCAAIGLAVQLLLDWPTAALLGCLVGVLAAPFVPKQRSCGSTRGGADDRSIPR